MYLLLPSWIAVAADSPVVDNKQEEKANSDKSDDASSDATTEENSDGNKFSTKSAWEAMWSGQHNMVNQMRETAIRLSNDFAERTNNLSEQLKPLEKEGRRLLVFVKNFQNYPNALESVNRRITAILGFIEKALEPVNMARSEVLPLLESINQLAASLPYDEDKSRLSPEMNAYINDITRARFRLTAVLAQYNSLMPSLTLVKQLEDTQKDITARLPTLWKEYYMQKPISWLNPDTWSNFGKNLYFFWQAALIRLPVEIPTTKSQWGNAGLRFSISLIFFGTLYVIFRRRLLHSGSLPVLQHIFNICFPLLIVGFSFMAAAVSASGDFFRVFVAIGSIAVILGQFFLSWDMRLLQYPDQKPVKSPFLILFNPAVCAYVISYLPISQALALILWLIVNIICLIYHKNPAKNLSNQMHLEKGCLDCYSILLWICLFLTVSGFYLYSILLYLSYLSFSLAMEISLGGMSIINNINEHLPQEGARAALIRLFVALAAPLVIVLAVIGICLWIAILPGGIYLLSEYALKGFSVGETQLNIVQALLIVSAFYLTRTVVSMGTRFLAKLPRQGTHFDATLITPLQTALTYVAWAVFGLFVLNSLGIELSSLAMVAGGLSVGIGFGMQTIVNNFLSGLILIFGRSLQVGDVIEVGGTTGRIRKISIRATMVETYDNAIIYVPNSEFISGRLINWTSFSRSVRREVQVGIAYGSDTQKATELLLSIASSHKNVLKYPAPSVLFADFAASSLDFRLRFWVKDYELGAITCSDIRDTINRIFKDNDIEIAFPQMDVHLRDTTGGIGSTLEQKISEG